MQTILLVIDPGKLKNPDLDLRYNIPERIAEITENAVQDNGYDYIDAKEGQPGPLLGIWLKTENAAANWPRIHRLFGEEVFLANDLSLSTEIYISPEDSADLGTCTRVYPADISSEERELLSGIRKPPPMILFRKYRPSDCEQLAALFYETVHTVNARDYTPEQLDAWADGQPDLQKWNESFLEHETIVAIVAGRLAGFGDMAPSGYLDRLYIHKDFQRQGIASVLCGRLEASVNAGKITTHASITAKPFFLHRGYRVIKEQQVFRKGIPLTNFMMEKNRK